MEKTAEEILEQIQSNADVFKVALKTYFEKVQMTGMTPYIDSTKQKVSEAEEALQDVDDFFKEKKASKKKADEFVQN